jgi:hypothetical protein
MWWGRHDRSLARDFVFWPARSQLARAKIHYTARGAEQEWITVPYTLVHCEQRVASARVFDRVCEANLRHCRSVTRIDGYIAVSFHETPHALH